MKGALLAALIDWAIALLFGVMLGLAMALSW
jgi:hypothetical protein